MTSEDSIVISRTKELCQAILDQPDFQALRRDIDAFMANEGAQTLYQQVMTKGEALQQKQQFGMALGAEEISDFEGERQRLSENPAARAFMDAQQALHKVQESVNSYVSKTFELGRVPATEDFSSESCGPSCGCH